MAFEQDEFGNLEWLGAEAACAFQEIGDFAVAPTFPAGKRNVRMERSAPRAQADLLADPFGLLRERGNGRLRLDAGPQCAAVSLLETTGTVIWQRKSAATNLTERRREIVGD